MRTTVKLTSAFVLWAVALSGCGSSGPGDLGQVSGTVTMDDKPLPDAQVIFSPANGRPSMGATDASGKYSLTYIRDTKGAVPGTHSVRITTIPKTTSDQDGLAPVKEPIPAKYNAESVLTAEVKAGENTVDFPLESK